MENGGCNRETIHFVKISSQHIDAVVPLPTQGTSLDDSMEITNVLLETKVDDGIQEVKPCSSAFDNREAD